MSDALKDATPDDLERYAEEMEQWADALGAKGRAFAAAADLLRAVAKVQRDAEFDCAPKIPHFSPPLVGDYHIGNDGHEVSFSAALASILEESPDAR